MRERSTWKVDLERWGLWPSLYQRLMGRARRWLVLSRVQLRVQDLGLTDPAAALQGCSVRLATRDELMEAARDPDFDLVPADVEAALARGDICAAAFDGDRMVSYVWRSFSSAKYGDDLWVEIRKPYRYGYKGYTVPEYRGRHLQNSVALFTDDLCVARGHTHALSLIETHNFSSVQSESRRHSILVGWVGYFKILGRTYPFRSPGARKHELRLRHKRDVAA
ncbi:MAG TPA: hypothetical protein VL379_09940 [Pseudomonadales bacterium]|nr:hypothetical protein [Pseudomonadales bacterium]